MNALFVYDPADLDATVAGGVQLCTREFLSVVQAAASRTILRPVAPSRSFHIRIRRRLGLGTYLGYEPTAAPELYAALRDEEITHVFLNRSELLRFAPAIKRYAPEVCVVLMSHGNQSGDDLYEIAGRGGRVKSVAQRSSAVWKLGLNLATESRLRHQAVDAVVVMSAEEEMLERWLGARRTCVLPRLLNPAALAWRPVHNRVGYVGTLDHTPNRVALEAVFAALLRQSAPCPAIRLVGGPVSAGENFAQRFPFVTYLGPLTDAALRDEASTWTLFLNPILWLSRGASMKLGVAVAWGLPVLTTRSGARGYEWGGADIPTCQDSADAFSQACTRLLRTAGAITAAKAASGQAVATAPNLSELAERLRRALA